jgi:hypothetical protein
VIGFLAQCLHSSGIKTGRDGVVAGPENNYIGKCRRFRLGVHCRQIHMAETDACPGAKSQLRKRLFWREIETASSTDCIGVRLDRERMRLKQRFSFEGKPARDSLTDQRGQVNRILPNTFRHVQPSRLGGYVLPKR